MTDTVKEIYNGKEFSYKSFDCEIYTLRRNEKTYQDYGVKEIFLYRGDKKIQVLSPEQVRDIVFDEQSGQLRPYIGAQCKKPNCLHAPEIEIAEAI